MLADVITKWGGIEVSPITVYKDIFHFGENFIQKTGEPKGLFKANPLGYYRNKGESKGHYRILFEDTFEEVLKELQKADFAIVNGLTYFGRKNLMSRASKMFAMIFDLDGVTDDTLENFFSGSFRAEAYPVPNYVILSGHGVHLYYIFDTPISLYPNIKIQLKTLKYALTTKMWNMYTSINEKKQFQGIYQGFRVIGGKTKIANVLVKAYQVNSHPYSLGSLSKVLPSEHWIDETKLWIDRKLSIKKAKTLYPDWYTKKIMNKEPKKTWTCNPALYQWWLNKIKNGATEIGHRYFCVMCLAIYGAKSGISFNQVKTDAYSLLPAFNSMNPKEPFLESDIKSALRCYDKKYKTFPIEDISKISGIAIKKNKRNGLKQDQHLYLARERKKNLKSINLPMKAPEGRPAKKDIVEGWQRTNPTGKKIDCERELNISRHTVLKWWK